LVFGEDGMMSDNTAAMGHDAMVAEFDESMIGPPGAIRRARVIRVDGRVVCLDIGSKFESVLPLSDWRDTELPPNVGDEIPVIIEDGLDVDDRPLRVARVTIHVVRRSSGWKFVAHAKPGDLHPGRIARRIKGGFLVDIGVNAFLPDEQVPEAMLATPEAFIGQTGSWRITKVDVKRLVIEIAPA
jgi:small subunit ribosomal protein S1